MTSRLFVSLDLPDYTLDEITSLRDEIYGVGSERVRWENESKLHITLKFLGDIEDSQQQKILAALQKAVAKFSRIEIRFNKFDMFLRNGIPSILWLGMNYSEEVSRLKNDIENEFAKIQIKKDSKRFKPHLTILRIKGRENKEQLNNFLQRDIPNVECYAKSVSLIKSELLPSGSVYTPIKSFQLI